MASLAVARSDIIKLLRVMVNKCDGVSIYGRTLSAELCQFVLSQPLRTSCAVELAIDFEWALSEGVAVRVDVVHSALGDAKLEVSHARLGN